MMPIVVLVKRAYIVGGRLDLSRRKYRKCCMCSSCEFFRTCIINVSENYAVISLLHCSYSNILHSYFPTILDNSASAPIYFSCVSILKITPHWMICGIFTIENEWIFDIQESCFYSIENSFPFSEKRAIFLCLLSSVAKKEWTINRFGRPAMFNRNVFIEYYCCPVKWLSLLMVIILF